MLVPDASTAIKLCTTTASVNSDNASDAHSRIHRNNLPHQPTVNGLSKHHLCCDAQKPSSITPSTSSPRYSWRRHGDSLIRSLLLNHRPHNAASPPPSAFRMSLPSPYPHFRLQHPHSPQPQTMTILATSPPTYPIHFYEAMD